MTTAWITRLGRIGAVAAVLAVGAATALAEEGKPADKPRGERNGRRMLEGPRVKAPTTQPGSRRGFAGDRREGPLEALHSVLAGLNLTEPQRTQVHGTLADAQAAHRAYRTAHEEEAKALQEQMKAAREAGDREKAREAGEKLKALMEGAPKPKDVVEKVRAVLTPEQQKSFDAALEKKREAMGEGPRKMGGAPTTQPGHRREMRGEGKPERRHDKSGDKKELNL